jgi:hypothetical protein
MLYIYICSIDDCHSFEEVLLCVFRLFPTQQSPIFDGAINKQVTPLKLSKSQNAEALDIGLTFAIQLLRQRYLH